MNVVGLIRAPVLSPGARSALHRALVVIAIVTAIPVAARTYERLEETGQEARTRFIQVHRLWELHPEYKGRPETWTRFAARLLSDRQIMLRIHTKYGSSAEEIELDYRRDLAIAQAEIVLRALMLWALPLLALYGGAFLFFRRRRLPDTKPVPANMNDPRYLPAQTDKTGEIS